MVCFRYIIVNTLHKRDDVDDYDDDSSSSSNNNNNNNNNGEWNMCYVETKGSTSDPDSNIIYGSNSKVTITKSNKT